MAAALPARGRLQDSTWPPASSLGSTVRGQGCGLCKDRSYNQGLLQPAPSPSAPPRAAPTSVPAAVLPASLPPIAHFQAPHPHCPPLPCPPRPWTQVSIPGHVSCQSPFKAQASFHFPDPRPQTFPDDSSVIPLHSPLQCSENTGL